MFENREEAAGPVIRSLIVFGHTWISLKATPAGRDSEHYPFCLKDFLPPGSPLEHHNPDSELLRELSTVGALQLRVSPAQLDKLPEGATLAVVTECSAKRFQFVKSYTCNRKTSDLATSLRRPCSYHAAMRVLLMVMEVLAAVGIAVRLHRRVNPQGQSQQWYSSNTTGTTVPVHEYLPLLVSLSYLSSQQKVSRLAYIYTSSAVTVHRDLQRLRAPLGRLAVLLAKSSTHAPIPNNSKGLSFQRRYHHGIGDCACFRSGSLRPSMGFTLGYSIIITVRTRQTL